ncbi:MAG: peptidylprolyl isomerase [Christensenellales bacterium]
MGNFISLANSGFYDGLIFHRVIPDFDDPGRRSAGHRHGWPRLFHPRRV